LGGEREDGGPKIKQSKRATEFQVGRVGGLKKKAHTSAESRKGRTLRSRKKNGRGGKNLKQLTQKTVHLGPFRSLRRRKEEKDSMGQTKGKGGGAAEGWGRQRDESRMLTGGANEYSL